ncbi:AAA family ATPase [Nocardia rhamnosiphila]|uniref:bifunctional aminoglycoside phosphotransferase/ATP-binding protein n=1 Tax=Nocardia rhamnosiphila TaxID=426716 RepID=UPI0033F8CD97
MTLSPTDSAEPVTHTEAAELRETHTGVVVLVGDRAYKVKKPIATDFLNFATPQDRERACRRELELNRRLAPDVYLGLAHLTDPIGGADEPVLVMRRMPDSRRLSTLLAETGRPVHDLRALVATVVAFHESALRGPDIDRAGTGAALRDRWRSVLGPLHGQPTAVVDPARLAAIEERALDYVRGRDRLFAQRIADGWLVDGHGDMLAEDIFDLPDGFRILDCLDFDDELRYIDRLDDIAFLAMDLEFLGHHGYAARLLTDYRQLSGDQAPSSLDHHYRAYRAAVRAKVDVIRYGQGDRAARDRAGRHLTLVEQHLEYGAIRLALVGGLPGTGKTTVAEQLAKATGAHLLSSDPIRRELMRAGEIAGAAGAYDAGAYTPGSRHRVYTELLERARPLLQMGVPVVLDAGWPAADERRRARELATTLGAEPVQLRCECPRDIADHRLHDRPRGESDATPPIAHAISTTAAPWPDAVVLDTRQSPDLVAAEALRRWHDSGHHRSRP